MANKHQRLVKVQPPSAIVVSHNDVVQGRHCILEALRVDVGAGEEQGSAHVEQLIPADSSSRPKMHHLVTFVVGAPRVRASQKQHLNHVDLPRLDDGAKQDV
eukprot:CAMPEP_0170395036 /NCGR_PEP_ID=MMETSP0117_2-20130122/21567_1 /TAXON_ID=400756 /ORGANISM="Durinskia baltica, Strain CSIRO CS-38" /LENGTH=101 /DNA_ID=CAMNT_0010651325 /DNA_START=292 /DNA_END=597 /DNA_ORIENTATION=+